MPFLNVPVKRGEIVRTRVPVGEFMDGTPVALPVVTIGGTKDGPVFYLQAGVHGDEMTGIEIARKFLATLDPSRIAGTVVCVPLANVPAHLSRTRGFLHEERWLMDINRMYPGNANGLLSERIAHTLLSEFVMAADLSMDLHSALDGCDIAPFTYVDPDDDQAGTRALRERVALGFGAPYVLYKSRVAALGTSDMTRSLNNQSDLARRAMVPMEVGESRRVSTQHLGMAVNGLHNALRILGVEAGEPSPVPAPRRFSKIALAHATHGGGVRMAVDLGDEVVSGQEVAEIVDVFGQTIERIHAPRDGFVLRVIRNGAIATGGEVVWVAA